MKEYAVSWLEVSIISCVITLLLGAVVWFLKNMHTQAMNKFDLLIENVNKLSTQQTVHNERLEVGKEQFVKIERHQKDQDDKIGDLRERVARIEITMRG
jgi:hypothetical protein